jgi:dienelactone hydrolase
MKKIISSIYLIFCLGQVFGQKPLIDTSVYGKWPQIGIRDLSPNGAYVYYNYKRKLTLRTVSGSWKKNITTNGEAVVSFADNNRLGVFQLAGDSLCIQTLGSDRRRYIMDVKSFVVPQNGKAEWLLYQTKRGNQLVIANLGTGKQQTIDPVTNYQIDPTGRCVLLEQSDKDNWVNLIWLDLKTQRLTSIWQGKSVAKRIFTRDGSSMAMIGNDAQGQKGVWYYHAGDEKARLLLNANSGNFPKGFKLGVLRSFNQLGDRLFIALIENIVRLKPDPKLASVDVYSYKDSVIQPEQLSQLSNAHPRIIYTYAFNLNTNKLFPIIEKNETIIREDFDKLSESQNYVLVQKSNGASADEGHWNPAGLESLYLVSTLDGSRVCLFKDKFVKALLSYGISPGEKYVVYYDTAAKNYFSYTIASGRRNQITQIVPGGWLMGRDGAADRILSDSIYGVSNKEYHWLKDDQAVLINSQTDIYQADPSGNKPMLCLTGEFGRKNHIQFSIEVIQTNRGLNTGLIDPIKPLVLNVYNLVTKEMARCEVKLNRGNIPQLLKMMPCFNNGRELYKARDADVYLDRLQSADSFPNLFLTKDFEHYEQLTDIQPQKQYNWLTSELVSWKLPDGETDQGILYKPENFDPTKRYPVIFTYYEQLSDRVNAFLMPGYSEGSELNIPTYVSNGYLVFEPDIHYMAGHAGKNACEAIVSAAQYLDQFPWADKVHMGLMGHSWGGFETNYVITHSHLFAAAASMAGVSDAISRYNSINSTSYTGPNAQPWLETGQPRMGTTLWERPDLYLENSPVFQADKITTPVLLMANHQDGSVHYTQGLEFFLALRRLGKKAWLLQYDKGTHGVIDPIEDRDVTLRLQQFFDYYLKGKTPPIWMTEGIPALKKQVDSGLEPDYSGKQP